jgi:signal peptidase
MQIQAFWHNRYRRFATDALFIVAVVFVIAAIGIYVGLQLWGVRFYEVTSDSMKGTFSEGDVVGVKAIAPHDVEDGDVIAYRRPGFPNPIVHRVQAVLNPLPDVVTVVHYPDGSEKEYWQYAHREFITKGDANPVEDPPVPQEQLIGQVVFVVPHPFHLIVTRFERSTLMMVGVAAIALYVAWEVADGIRTVVRRRRAATPGEGA